MKYFRLIALFVFVSLVVSCEKNDEEIIQSCEEKFFISSITSDNLSENYDYNDEGSIGAWEYSNSDLGWEDEFKSTYDYSESGVISIHSIYDSRFSTTYHHRRIFDEELYLDDYGLAKSAEGEVMVYESEILMMHKKYISEFSYDSLGHLVSVKISERRVLGNGNLEPNPLVWYNVFTWQGENLIRDVCYVNPDYPLSSTTYSYYKGNSIYNSNSVKYFPILQYPLVRAYYKPLQYQGVLGVQSKNLLKDVYFENNSQSNISYVYYLSESADDKYVEGYVLTTPNIENPTHEYGATVTWETKK